jgi:hypothetical protein
MIWQKMKVENSRDVMLLTAIQWPSAGMNTGIQLIADLNAAHMALAASG